MTAQNFWIWLQAVSRAIDCLAALPCHVVSCLCSAQLRSGAGQAWGRQGTVLAAVPVASKIQKLKFWNSEIHSMEDSFQREPATWLLQPG